MMVEVERVIAEQEGRNMDFKQVSGLQARTQYIVRAELCVDQYGNVTDEWSETEMGPMDRMDLIEFCQMLRSYGGPYGECYRNVTIEQRQAVTVPLEDWQVLYKLDPTTDSYVDVAEDQEQVDAEFQKLIAEGAE